METISLFNGNEQRYKQEMPRLFICTSNINDVALNHIKKNTGLNFVKGGWGYQATPKTSKQVLKLLLTYDFKTQYNDNVSIKNTILLKWVDNAGFRADTICFKCCEYNNINTNGLTKKDKLRIGGY